MRSLAAFGQMRVRAGVHAATLATSHLPGRALEVEVFEGNNGAKGSV